MAVPAGEMPRPALIARLTLATTRYPFKVWGFGESIAMEALLAAGGRGAAFAADLIERWADDAPALAGDPLAHVAPGVPLLQMTKRNSTPSLRRRAAELAAVLDRLHTGAYGARIHRPDLRGWEHEVWVDCMHLDGPFLARYASVTGEPAWADLAATLLLSHAAVLQDDTSGLFSHGFDDLVGLANGVHWGRGQGWALLGLVDTLRALPAGHAAAMEIRQRLARLLDALAASEDSCGGAWRTVVDEPRTPLEPSVAAYVALGVGRAVRAGLAPGHYRALASRAWTMTLAALQTDGTLTGVSEATPVGPDWTHYQARRTGVFPWGQGPALLAALELEADDHGQGELA